MACLVEYSDPSNMKDLILIVGRRLYFQLFGERDFYKGSELAHWRILYIAVVTLASADDVIVLCFI